jgi:AmiR/NasT family two-component response regulator
MRKAIKIVPIGVKLACVICYTLRWCLETYGKVEIRSGLRGNEMSIRILIADDEPLQRMDLRDMLTEQGYQVIGEVRDGLSAIRRARLERPDVVIMDIQMPIMDGLSAAEILTREKIAPVVLATALSDQASIQRAAHAGVVSYIIKPLRESEIVPTIELALARYREYCRIETAVDTLLKELAVRNPVERPHAVPQKRSQLVKERETSVVVKYKK